MSIPAVSSPTNAGVLLQRQSCACGGGCPSCAEQLRPEQLQTKLKVSLPGDEGEREADRIADQIVSKPQADLPTSKNREYVSAAVVYARDSLTNDEEVLPQEPAGSLTGIQRNSSHPMSPLGNGEPLSPASQMFFESRFGHDFGAVRVHADGPAAARAAQVKARAYTLNHDIVFGAGQYQPETSSGSRLLAHELTHVVQAGIEAGASWRRQAEPGTPHVSSPLSANQVARDPDDSATTPAEQDYSLSQLEAEIAQLRAQLSEMQADSEERQLLIHRLEAFEAALRTRQRAGMASAEIANIERKAPGPLENRIAIAFSAGFAAGALMEFRPAEASRLVAEIEANPGSFGAGIIWGEIEGAGMDIWNNIVGLGELLLWTQPSYWTYLAARAAINCMSDYDACRRQLRERQEQVDALTTGLAQLLLAVARDPSFLVTQGHELGLILGADAAAWFNDTFMRKAPFEKGETIGIAIGTIIVEVALLFVGPEEWIARGGTAAADAMRASGGLKNAIVHLMERIPSLRRLLEVRRLSGGAHAAEEAAQGARALEHAAGVAADTRHAGQAVGETSSAVREAERLTPPPGPDVTHAPPPRDVPPPPATDVTHPPPPEVPHEPAIVEAHPPASAEVAHEPAVVEAEAGAATEPAHATHATEAPPVAATETAPPATTGTQRPPATASGGSVPPAAGAGPRNYANRSLDELRQLAVTDAEAAEAMLLRYRAMSEAELQALAQRGDETAEAILRQQIPSNEQDLARALGSDYRPPHSATVSVTDSRGALTRGDRLESGNMTPDEAALGFPQSSLATHTEARAVRQPLHAGDVMRLTGEYNPCSSCIGKMDRAARESGATIIYWWPGGEMRFPRPRRPRRPRRP